MCLTAEHVYSDHRSLGLPLCGTSGGLGGWGVRHDFLAVWSAGMISSAINTLMALEESGPFLSHLFIVTTPRGYYVTLSLVLFSFLVRSWFDTQDATLNVFLFDLTL